MAGSGGGVRSIDQPGERRQRSARNVLGRPLDSMGVSDWQDSPAWRDWFSPNQVRILEALVMFGLWAGCEDARSFARLRGVVLDLAGGCFT
jgi:hypothetical protein